MKFKYVSLFIIPSEEFGKQNFLDCLICLTTPFKFSKGSGIPIFHHSLTLLPAQIL